MVEENDSIIRKSVWKVVPRLVDKLVVSSIRIYKVSQAIDGSVKNTRIGLWLEGSLRWREFIMRRSYL